MFRSAVDAILQPREAAHWLILLLASLGLTSLLLAPLKSDRPTAILFQGLVWACLLAAALTRLLWGSVYLTRQWSTTEAIITISAEALMLTAAIVPGLRRVPAAAAPGQFFLWTVIGVSSSLVIGMSGSAVYSQMAMFTCLIPLTCGLFTWWTRHSQSATHLPAGFIVASLGLHLWLAHYFAELTRLNEFLLIAALVGAGWYGFLSHQSTVNVNARWLRRLAAASSLLFAVTALVLAGKAFSDAVSANPYY